MENEPKLKAYIIEKTIPDKNGNVWGMVGLTELTEDGVWHCGLSIITRIEDAVERSAREKVPLWTREYLESIREETQKQQIIDDMEYGCDKIVEREKEKWQKELAEKIEKMKRDEIKEKAREILGGLDRKTGYNQAIEDILELLK